MIYDRAMFRWLRKRDKSEMARRLNEFRAAIVNKYVGPEAKVLDFGMGCGTFIKTRGNCVGYDINPAAVTWLKRRRAYRDPWTADLHDVAGVTFWDALEHVQTPEPLLRRMNGQFLFVSIPIFRDREHLNHSKHMKPGEHHWYFTREQFEKFMGENGYQIVEATDAETRLGREDIWTFVLKRKR